MSRIILLNEGFSSGIWQSMLGKNEKTISQYILPVIFRSGENKVYPNNWTEIQSTRAKSKKQMKKFIEKHANNNNSLEVYTKSFGGEEFRRYLNSDKGQEILKKYYQITWHAIDLNAKKISKKYREYYIKGITGKLYTGLSKMRVFNYYQRNKTPYGAVLRSNEVNVRNINLTVTKVDHMSIVKSDYIRKNIEVSI